MSFFGDVGNAAKGAVKTAVGIAPYGARIVAERNAADESKRKQSLSEYYQKQNNDRANNLAGVKGAGEWDRAEPFTLPDGSTIMAERHKQTGEYRPARLSGYAPPSTPSAIPDESPPDETGGVDVSASGAPSISSLPGPSQIPQSQAPSQGPSQGILRPYVKPVPGGKIDPNSAAGIAAAGQKAGAVAAARAPYAKPTAPAHIDPLSREGIVADSTRAAKVAQATAPFKKDPNATTAGGAMSGQTMATMARMGTSYNDLKQAIDQMDAYENNPANLAKQTPSRQAIGAASEVHPSQEAHGLIGALNNAAGAFVGAKAQEQLKDDPEYRTYLNNKLRVATAFTELLPRPNQALLQLEKGLSGQDVGWNPQLVKNIQSRRRGGLDVLKNILGSQGMLDAHGDMTGVRQSPGGGRGGSPPPNVPRPAAPPNPTDKPGVDIGAGVAPSPLRQKYDAAVAHLRAQKKTYAEIHAVLGDPPGGD